MKKSIIVTIFSFLFTICIAGCGDSKFDPEVTVDNPDLNGNVHFTLLQTTDMHHRAGGSGASATYSPVDGIDSSNSTDLTTGGYARIAAKISEIRNAKKNKNILLVDSGDFLMGTVYDFSLAGPPLAFAFFEAMNYDAVTLGNHEFDFGPAPLAGFINQARGAGFTVPLLASNLVTDDTDTDDTSNKDNGIKAFIDADIIKSYEIITLTNGLKVGMIGLMGATAETAAPLASPVTFTNDLTDTTQVETLQTLVTDLKAQVDIVMALSHSGVSNTDPASPAGDDITLAQQVTGIDIIASGHDHATTDSVLEITNGDHTTYIICAGHYGKNLAQLDVAYTVETGSIAGVSLTNNAINDSIEGDYITQVIVDGYEAVINAEIDPLTVHGIVGTTDSDNVGKSPYAAESGIGNLVADSLRYVGLSLGLSDDHTLSVVANGVVRNGFTQGQQISFADLYSVLPLGMTLEDPISIENAAPGYPLVKVYLTGAEIKNMAQLISYVIAAGDTDFVSSLGTLDPSEIQMRAQLLQLAGGLNSGTPIDIGTYAMYVAPATDQLSIAAQTAFSTAKTNGADDSTACQAAAQVFSVYALTNAGDGSKVLQLVLPSLNSDYFLHVSGVQYTHTGSAGSYLIDPASVKMYAKTDIKCTSEPTAVADGTFYPVIVDIYVVLMMQDPVFVTLLSGLGIPVVPTNSDGSENVTKANIMDYAIKPNGTTEIKEWQAFLTYLTSSELTLGLGSLIPDSAYGSAAINATTGYTSRVNQP